MLTLVLVTATRVRRDENRALERGLQKYVKKNGTSAPPDRGDAIRFRRANLRCRVVQGAMRHEEPRVRPPHDEINERACVASDERLCEFNPSGV